MLLAALPAVLAAQHHLGARERGAGRAAQAHAFRGQATAAATDKVSAGSDARRDRRCAERGRGARDGRGEKGRGGRPEQHVETQVEPGTTADEALKTISTSREVTAGQEGAASSSADPAAAPAIPLDESTTLTAKSQSTPRQPSSSTLSGNKLAQSAAATAKPSTRRPLAKLNLSATKAADLLFPLPPSWLRGLLRVKIKHELEEGRGKGWVWHKGATHHGNREPDDAELKKVCEMYGYKWTLDAERQVTEKTKAEGKLDQMEMPPGQLYLMVSTALQYKLNHQRLTLSLSQMLADVLLCFPRNPLSGVVSPPLLATTGILPLSIFSTGPDIIGGQYYDSIIAAKREVIIMTNYWQNGKNVDTIADALRELDARETKRKEKGLSKAAPELGYKIPVKIMWDRGPRTLADLFRLRKPVPPGMWKENGLPEEKEVPNLTIEILNYHRPLMGTFHVKLLLVDRLVALINSNNIQDRPNLEACVRLEGDIVNSIYDHALLSWGNVLQPPLPCLFTPAPAWPGEGAFAVQPAVEEAIARLKRGLDSSHTGSEASPGTPAEHTKPKITIVPPSASLHSDVPLNEMTRAQLLQRANDARQQLRMDDEEAEEEKERSSMPSPRRSLTGVVDSVMARRRGSAGGTPADTPIDSQSGAFAELKGCIRSGARRRLPMRAQQMRRSRPRRRSRPPKWMASTRRPLRRSSSVRARGKLVRYGPTRCLGSGSKGSTTALPLGTSALAPRMRLRQRLLVPARLRQTPPPPRRTLPLFL